MDVTLSGIRAFVSLMQPSNSPPGIAVRFAGRETAVSAVQPANARTPMVVTPAGSVTDSSAVLSANARAEISSTGRLSNVSGTVSAVSAPM